MKYRPIIMTGPSLPALADGTKTQTRRLVKHLPAYKKAPSGDRLSKIIAGCPYGVVGDRLWVREAFAEFAVGNRTGVSSTCIAYRASCATDGGFDYVNNGDEIMRLKVTKWTSPLFMPRWAARITLELTEVRVQRLQEISEEDARAEGVARDTSPCDHKRYSCEEIGCMGQTHRAGFCDRWCDLHGIDTWLSNPLVWALSLKTVQSAASRRGERP